MKNKKIIIVGDEDNYSRKVLEKDIKNFSDISGDYNPIHLDENYAKNTIFKKRIAHGMFISSFISKVIAEKLPGKGTLYLYQDLNFLKPVFINDIIRTSVKVIEIINSKKIRLKTICENQNSEIVINGEAIVMPPVGVKIID